jgi:L-alanine-DL-glutamate epimerase-like enolase superfamily enzyme
MMTVLAGFSITRFEFARDRVIGDSQVRIDRVNLGLLELHDAEGRIGVGFFSSLFSPLPGQSAMARLFEAEAMPGLRRHEPAALINRQTRPRGGNRRPLPLNFEEAIDQALWDLHAKQLGLPLWRLLGGEKNTVRAYASGLDYHLSDKDFVRFFGGARERGFDAFKVKVGHPDVAWDLHRLKLLREAVGDGAILMVDSNEAWSPKEAIRRLHLYRDAGHAIFWVEDPTLRDDYAGLRAIADAVPFCHVNSGEYLDLQGKRELLEARGAEILNCHGRISHTLRAAWLAGEYGVPVSIGNTSLELGVHLAVALPECEWLEYSFQNTQVLAENPIVPDRGIATAPDAPGLGIVISDAARCELAVPESGARSVHPVPRSPLPLC